jgi:hypothetical protein
MVRSTLFLAAAGLLSWLPPAPAAALEKTPLPASVLDDPTEAWQRTNTLSVVYYNSCNGWLWTWSNFELEERAGVTFSAPPSGPLLTLTGVAVLGAHNAGYGYTGTIAVHGADANGCPLDPPLDQQPFYHTWGANFIYNGWNTSLRDENVLVITQRFDWVNDYGLRFLTDRPGPGRDGRIGCGVCYPVDRTTHSFIYGTAASPLCPGEPFFDGYCNAELLAVIHMGAATDVEPTSWGSVKALYK